MESDAAGVILAGAARLEVLLICIKCFGDGERSALIDGFARLPACKLPLGLLSLPIGQDVRRGGGFEIIGEPDLLEPLPAKAIAAPNAPRARPRVAPVCERDSGRETDLIGLLADGQLAAGRGGFELGGTRLGH